MARWRRPVVALGAIVLVFGAGVLAWDASGRLAPVESGRLYRSKAMDPARLVRVCRRLGIRTVVNLQNDAEAARREGLALERAGIRYIHLPSTQVPDLATVDRFLDIVDAPDHLPVLLHCRHGVGRSGVFAAVYRLERQAWSRRAALAEALVMAGGGSFGPGSAKRAFLAGYRLRRDRAGNAPPADAPSTLY